MMSQVYRLRIAGIGGQGVVHLATTIGAAAATGGIPVSVIDRPRSAMRLGPITCDLCFGQTEFAPFIVPGEADAVLGMEPLDGVMNAAYFLKPNGTLVLQARQTPTIEEVLSGQEDVRRTQWKQALEQRGGRVVWANPSDGGERGRNYYMLGVLTAACPDFPVSRESLERELADQAANLAAFRSGLAAAV
jgi:Pyruvate/2-oxoacid:ferredoxin oxidoreductase gamma subunit